LTGQILYKSIVKRAEDEDSFTEKLNRHSDDESEEDLEQKAEEKPKQERNIPIEELRVKRATEHSVEERSKNAELRRSATINSNLQVGSPEIKHVKVGGSDQSTPKQPQMHQTEGKSFIFPDVMNKGGELLKNFKGKGLSLPKDDRVIFALASGVLAVLLLTCFYLIIQN
jgi:hypothetical protein